MIDTLIDRLRGLWLTAITLIQPDLAWKNLDDEVRFHVDMEAERLRTEGLPPKEARRKAMLRFGGVHRFQEQTREARGTKLAEDTMQDLKS